MPENSRDKFIRIANNRVNKAIKAINLIGNLSNRTNYSYDEKDIDKIFKALNDEIRSCRKRFETLGDADNEVFRLE